MIDAVARLEQCIDRVDKGMAASRLILNSGKSEVIWVGSAWNLQKHYCCSLLAGSLWSITDKLQRLLNATARVVKNTGKFERRLTQTIHRDLHWLDVPERIQFRVVSTGVYTACRHRI
jgi:hypothetical protein